MYNLNLFDNFFFNIILIDNRQREIKHRHSSPVPSSPRSRRK